MLFTLALNQFSVHSSSSGPALTHRQTFSLQEGSPRLRGSDCSWFPSAPQQSSAMPRSHPREQHRELWSQVPSAQTSMSQMANHRIVEWFGLEGI